MAKPHVSSYGDSFRDTDIMHMLAMPILTMKGTSHLVFGGAPAQDVSPDVSLLQASIHLLNLPPGDHNLSQEVVSAHVALAVDGDLQQAYILVRTELNMLRMKSLFLHICASTKCRTDSTWQ
jgi:hypothetical protein